MFTTAIFQTIASASRFMSALVCQMGKTGLQWFPMSLNQLKAHQSFIALIASNPCDRGYEPTSLHPRVSESFV